MHPYARTVVPGSLAGVGNRRITPRKETLRSFTARTDKPISRGRDNYHMHIIFNEARTLF